MKTLAFISSYANAGDASVIHDLAWALSELRLRVLVADLSPTVEIMRRFAGDQSERRTFARWHYVALPDPTLLATLLDRCSPSPLDLPPALMKTEGPTLLLGDPGLPQLEQLFAAARAEAESTDPVAHQRARHVLDAPKRLLRQLAEAEEANLVLVYLGAAHGELAHAAMAACDQLVVLVMHRGYAVRAMEAFRPVTSLPAAGYIVHSAPGAAGLLTEDWEGHPSTTRAIRDRFYRHVLGVQTPRFDNPRWPNDPMLLAELREFSDLDLLGRESSKATHLLTAADGALGSLAMAVSMVKQDYENLARRIAERCGIALSS